MNRAAMTKLGFFDSGFRIGDWVMIKPGVELDIAANAVRFADARLHPWRIVRIQHRVRDVDGRVGDILDLERDDPDHAGDKLLVTISAFGVELDAAWLMTQTMNGSRP